MVTIDIKNIEVSLICMANFIKNRNIKNTREKDIPYIEGFSKVTWTFVSSIFERGWDILRSGDNNKYFW